MHASLVIAGKDLRQRLRDRSAVLVAIVVPLVLASIFGLIFRNVTGGHVTFTVGVVDQDHGPAARVFVSRVLRPLEQKGLLEVRTEPSVAAGRTAADQGRVAATFVLPTGFSTAVGHGGSPVLRVLGSPDQPIGTQVAESIAESYAAQIDTVRIAAATLHLPGASPALFASLRDPVVLADVSTKSKQLSAGTFYAAGMAVFFLFFTVQFGVSSILDERRDRTLARMLVAPIPRSAVLVGKLLTSIVLGVISMTVLALATHFLLDAHWGNPLAVAILIVSGVLAATAVMALVATLARTPDQAEAWQAMVALVLGMLGGTFFPVSQAGGLLATLSLATPQAWFMRGIENLVGGAGASVVLGPALAILAFAAVTGALAFLRAGRLVAP
jgi:linearmycin/streptolysin S transport system permease protein